MKRNVFKTLTNFPKCHKTLYYKNTVNGYEITNTFTRPEDLMTLTVTKIWEDQEYM